MGDFISVFQHPVKGTYKASMQQSTLSEEVAAANECHQTAEFGAYLYSRPVCQVPMRTGERYAISFNNAANHLKYRKHDEAFTGSLDYYRIGGPQRSTVVFLVDHGISVPEGGFNADVRIELQFEAARSNQFRDMCKTHLACVEVGEGKVVMRFYESGHAQQATFEVPLETLGDQPR
jgi:hypothetical protein